MTMGGRFSAVPIPAGARRVRSRGRARRRVAAAAAALAAVLAILLPAVALAHPLGNFTINHFAGVRVSSDRVDLDVVIDRAEIPTFQERQRIASELPDEGDPQAPTSRCLRSSSGARARLRRRGPSRAR